MTDLSLSLSSCLLLDHFSLNVQFERSRKTPTASSPMSHITHLKQTFKYNSKALLLHPGTTFTFPGCNTFLAHSRQITNALVFLTSTCRAEIPISAEICSILLPLNLCHYASYCHSLWSSILTLFQHGGGWSWEVLSKANFTSFLLLSVQRVSTKLTPKTRFGIIQLFSFTMAISLSA